jgi:hypothetical protein
VSAAGAVCGEAIPADFGADPRPSFFALLKFGLLSFLETMLQATVLGIYGTTFGTKDHFGTRTSHGSRRLLYLHTLFKPCVTRRSPHRHCIRARHMPPPSAAARPIDSAVPDSELLGHAQLEIDGGHLT